VVILFVELSCKEDGQVNNKSVSGYQVRSTPTLRKPIDWLRKRRIALSGNSSLLRNA
jgi:hypothetical protein